jgi:hypothetical protein
VVDLKLLLLATAGIDPVTKGPTEAGIWRLTTANEAIRNGLCSVVAIIGGRRLFGKNEAEVYYEYAKKYFPALADRIVIVDASATCTNRDLLAAGPKIDKYLASVGESRTTTAIIIVSYDRHMDRMEITLRWMGFSSIFRINSLEKSEYPWWKEALTYWVTRFDPAWRGLAGRLLVCVADRRLKEDAT